MGRTCVHVGVLCLVILAFALAAPAVLAYEETTGTPVHTPTDPSTIPRHTSACFDCHGFDGSWCPQCHNFGFDGHGQGPHTGYRTATDFCGSCHEVHDAPEGGIKLLPAATIKAICESCHDGTGGYGVYGTVAARGLTPGGGHSIDTTDVVPGGDPATGGSSVATFLGESSFMTCSDCHSPHDSDTVEAFVGDRLRTTLLWDDPLYSSNKLLRRQPTGAATAVAEYGSDWCLSCHAGRSSGAAVHNHPVDSSIVTTDPFIYRNVAILDGDDPTSQTVIGQLGGWSRPYGPGGPANLGYNRGYLMPYPRTAEQGAHYPICQQCHEDSRSVGSLVGDGSVGDAEPVSITHEDGTVTTDNPRFQNFPHETVNASMLVETADDLCLNCHPVAALP